MLRFVNICLVLGLVALAYVIYQVKYETRSLDADIATLNKQIDDERDAIAVLRAEWSLLNRPERIERLWANTRRFKDGLRALGFDIGQSETPITPVIAGAGALAMKLSDRLFEEGVFAQGIGYPTVPEAKSRVRTIVTAEHTDEDLDTCLAAFETVGRELALI